MPEVMPYDEALVEVNIWLDYKKVSQKKRDTYKDAIEKLASAMSEGNITMNDKYEITHNLLFPINDTKGNVALDKLVYQPRVDIGTISARQAGQKMNGTTAVIITYVSAITGTAIGILNKLDSEDNDIAQSIGVFFV